MDHGSWMKDHGSWITDHGSKIMDQGSWIKDHKSKIKDQRSKIKDHGPCFGTNEHPRKDSDVILRLSESTIEDLPFYIGFAPALAEPRKEARDNRRRATHDHNNTSESTAGVHERRAPLSANMVPESNYT